MKFFWPRRSNAKGFSIQNVSSKYTVNISGDSSKEKPKKLLDHRVLKSKNKDSINIALSDLSIKKVHWANRDFSEYREAA